MCVVSMIGDHYHNKWRDPGYQDLFKQITQPTHADLKKVEDKIEALRKEVKEMKELLKRAKIYDEKNNEPNCEIEQKLETLRKVAELVGVNLDELIGSKNK